MTSAEILSAESIETRLCCHCGVCAGICPSGAIQMGRNEVSVFPEKCVDCGLCIHSCPAKGYRLSDATLEDIRELPSFSAASLDNSIMSAAASGGFVTQALLSLLENKDITAAAVVVPGENMNESSSRFIIAASREEILSAQRSKYTQASIAGVLSHIKSVEGRYAIVGLPCQMYAVTRAMDRLPVLKSRIAYKIGMVCGYTYDEECIDALLNVLGTSRDQTASITGWREGGLPGSFSVKLKSGEARSMPFIDEHSIDVTYFAQNRCRLCKDCLCDYGDVVTADIGGWRERKTLVIARNRAGQELLNKLKNYRQLSLERCSVPFEKTVLPFMLREKRAKVDIRLQRCKKKRLPCTSFIGGYSPRLLLSQKIHASLSISLERKAVKNAGKHTREKMLKLGHLAYHKLSSSIFLKILYKLQVCLSRGTKMSVRVMNAAARRMTLLMRGRSCFGSEKPVRAVVIGLGQWGSQYLFFLKSSKFFELVSAFDYDTEKLKKLSKKYGFKPAENVDDLCTNYRADAVFVLTPTPTHTDVFEEISTYGLPVYMEKPLADHLTGACKIADIAYEKNLFLYVAHSMKYEPAIQKIKDLLNSADLGAISSIKMVRTVKSKKTSYYSHAALYQIGVHLIDVFYFLFGLIDPETAVHFEKTEDTVETLSFSHHSANVILHYGFCDYYNFSITVIAEKGYIMLADSKLRAVVGHSETVYKIPMENEKTVRSQLSEFYSAVRKDSDVLNSINNAMNIMSFCDRITTAEE